MLLFSDLVAMTCSYWQKQNSTWAEWKWIHSQRYQWFHKMFRSKKLGLTNKIKKASSFCQTWGICLLDCKYVLNTFRSGANCLYRGHTREYKRLASCLFHELICKSNVKSGTGRAILPLSCRLWKTVRLEFLFVYRHVKTQRGNTFWEMWSDTEPCKQ